MAGKNVDLNAFRVPKYSFQHYFFNKTLKVTVNRFTFAVIKTKP